MPTIDEPVVQHRDKAAFVLAVPRVHLNGTSRGALLDGYNDAHGELGRAARVLAESAPNARDYYVQGPEAFTAAVKQHEARLQKIADVRFELELIIAAIDEQPRR